MVNGDRRLLIRIVAGAVVVVFAFVTTITTIISVGKYCLTSDGADTSSLPDHRP